MPFVNISLARGKPVEYLRAVSQAVHDALVAEFRMKPDAAAEATGSREAYTKSEMTYAITELFGRRDSSRILPMLRQDFVLKIPATLPYGGEFTGPEAFADFFAGTPGGAQVWESFDVHVDQVIESPDYLVAQLTNTAVLKATGKPVVFQNAWIFETAGGRLVNAQLYADTAAASAPGAASGVAGR